MNRVAARGVGAVLVVALAACVPTPREDRDASEVIHDEEAGGYYTEDSVTTDLSVLDGELGGVPVTDSGVLVEGQHTDPEERVPMPAPDDYWVHAAIDVDPEVADRLVGAAVPSGDGLPAEAVPIPEITPLVVEPVEEAMRECPGGWYTVDPLTPPGEEGSDSGTFTTSGLGVMDAFACRGGDQVLVVLDEF